MKLLFILAANLGENLYSQFADKNSKAWDGLDVKSIDSSYPALTCPAQAHLRTASGVENHAMGASGYFDRTLGKPFFWEQSARLYTGERIWENFRKNGGKVAQICLQQCPGPDSDFYLSPAPVHKHHGGMIQDFFCEPENLYREICADTGMKFNLMDYWGPFTSIRCSKWIAGAADRVMARMKSEKDAIVFAYIPHLDYAAQKYGVTSNQARKSFAEFEEILTTLRSSASKHGFNTALAGDYAMTDVKRPLYPNRILVENNLLRLRTVKNMLYPNIHSSKAFALADHQICHIYILDSSIDIGKIKSIFENVPGIERVIERDKSDEFNNPRCGELILEAASDSWFAYKFWEDDANAPDYATHVDIHNKPGFDPLEMYFKLWPPMSTALDCTLLKASHGRRSKVMYASDSGLEAASFEELALNLKAMLDKC